ncbi:hypothetical protein FIBSPDRAFT_1043925 [Athelia psychrophila]|uniref:Uncharacterized protein n=1 Tax=Athelia psychrophila TaxID=1759441 RepID=A0A166KEE6_9AGAM|nr:hypothetical protein FIBSPDRAFT_1043925 [Fibularhizoctonia sp. CBS 109695]
MRFPALCSDGFTCSPGREAAVVFVVALIAPEWILAWALRQALVAWKLAGKLNKARSAAAAKQKERVWEIFSDVERDVAEITTNADGHSSMPKVQCIAQHAEHLPVTSLEVMTLAYTVITVAMYAAWWAKPLNVSCAIRVPEGEVKVKKAEKYNSVWDRIFPYVLGYQDDAVDLHKCKRVPTFWAGKANGTDIGIADITALLVAMVFGAVH